MSISVAQVVKALAWSVKQRVFLGPKATFDCGACGHINRKLPLFPVTVREIESPVVIGYCKKCGQANCFADENKGLMVV